MIKDMDEQPDKDTRRARSWRVVNTGAYFVMELGVPPSRHVDVFTNPGAP